MKLLKKAILVLGIALFAMQSGQAGIVSGITNFAKKHNKLTSGLVGIATAVTANSLFPQSYIEEMTLSKYLIENPEYKKLKEELELMREAKIDYCGSDPIILNYLSRIPLYTKVLKFMSPYIYTKTGQDISNVLTILKITTSLIAGYMAYKKTNEYLNKDKKQS